jgi:hypothetical protein
MKQVAAPPGRNRVYIGPDPSHRLQAGRASRHTDGSNSFPGSFAVVTAGKIGIWSAIPCLKQKSSTRSTSDTGWTTTSSFISDHSSARDSSCLFIAHLCAAHTASPMPVIRENVISCLHRRVAREPHLASFPCGGLPARVPSVNLSDAASYSNTAYPHPPLSANLCEFSARLHETVGNNC